MEEISFNINDIIKVKLTSVGKAKLRSNYEIAKRDWQTLTIPEYEPPKEDEDGWSRWPLWKLMETFRSCVDWQGSNGYPMFEQEIKLEKY